jgi:acyl-CoA synthetase (AMP-forming)/AMP-acid ligase II
VDGVLEVAAIAVPSELGGDDLKIVVVARDDAKLTPEKLIAHAQSQLARCSIPRYVDSFLRCPKRLPTRFRGTCCASNLLPPPPGLHHVGVDADLTRAADD